LRGNDCVAITAQSSHSGGSPINQRECAGFNWPVLVVSAEDPVCASPESIDRLGQDDSAAIESVNAGPKPHFFPRSALFATISSNVPFGSISLAVGVGHEVKSLSDVRRADARSRETDRPCGVTDSFQVILNKVEPVMSDRAFNLFAKDDARAADVDEVEIRRP
jgi:hypothetical protein